VGSPGLRERKRIETRRALSSAALELVLERGLDDVTVEQIAAAADVAPRTFFNYFSSKHEALVGLGPEAIEDTADALRARPPDEGARDALFAVLAGDTNSSDVLRRYKQRSELVRRYPELIPRYLETGVLLERALSGALAERLGFDDAVDPYPRAAAAVATSLVRTTLSWWREHGADDAHLVDTIKELFDTFIPEASAS
jgi:AcrR family transcriptional regulator